ncbi:MAG: lipopolysaccharide biosynthesis protein [Lysobacter sp.]
MLLWIGLHLAIGAAGTLLARRYAVARDLLDHPGERRSHQVATPRGGGIAIVAAVLVAVVALAVRDESQRWLLASFGGGLLLVAGIGLLDDHRPLSARLRLAVHGLAGSIFAASVYLATGSPWTALFALALTLVLTNIWNFMDGINGLAASQALLVAGALGWMLGGSWGLLALALAAACAGFLPFNFPSARIFLGDVGSGAIGYALAGLVTIAVMRHATTAAWLLLPLSAFLLDASLTLIMRLLQGERWWTAHTRHAYQCWARRVGHSRVTMAYAGWTALAVGVAVLFQAQGAPAALLASATACVTGTAVWWKLNERSRL